MHPENLQLLTLTQVATTLAIGKSTIWRLVKDGKFPKPVKIAGSTRWRRVDIEALVTGEKGGN